MSNKDNPLVKKMVDDVLGICDPCSVYLISAKYSSKGELTTFKLCLVVDDSADPSKTESALLLGTDCPVPCDFIVYNLTDWNECAEDDCSFAYRVENGGELLYVKKQP